MICLVLYAQAKCVRYHPLAFDVTLELARSALFGFEAVIFPSFRPGFDVFTGQGIQRAKNLELGKIWVDAPKNQDRYHDDDLISLLSVNAGNVYSREPLYNLKGLRLSSQFFLKVIEVCTSACLAILSPSNPNSRIFILGAYLRRVERKLRLRHPRFRGR